ncbi:MAG TPA: 2-hydroxychromene-2-carboxylate isomerase [Stellaceae bacterium]|nr:2-hydroxychromene-2-carboxylate isomerase [Stellaceae bacterium]
MIRNLLFANADVALEVRRFNQMIALCARNRPSRGNALSDSGTVKEGKPIEFWFDFASGYAYFAAVEIEALAARHGRTVLWRPFTLGAAFKITGAQGLSRTPLKRDYARRDWERLARLKGLVFNLPEKHPRVGLAAIRAFYHLERSNTHAAAVLAKHIILGYFEDGLDIDDPNAIAGFTSSLLGLSPDMILAGIADTEVKAIARQRGEQAVARGVFGSPWIFVDGEPFWGCDRLPMVEDWLVRGPW